MLLELKIGIGIGTLLLIVCHFNWFHLTVVRSFSLSFILLWMSNNTNIYRERYIYKQIFYFLSKQISILTVDIIHVMCTSTDNIVFVWFSLVWLNLKIKFSAFVQFRCQYELFWFFSIKTLSAQERDVKKSRKIHLFKWFFLRSTKHWPSLCSGFYAITLMFQYRITFIIMMVILKQVRCCCCCIYKFLDRCFFLPFIAFLICFYHLLLFGEACRRTFCLLISGVCVSAIESQQTG